MVKLKAKKEIFKIYGKSRELITITDDKGNVLKRFVNPITAKFYPRDFMQVMVGASILAVPVAFTEETWNLGESLPILNIFGLMLLSIIFISAFVYYNYYRGKMKENRKEFVKRVFTTYFMSFLVVTLILTLIERAPWSNDLILAFSRTVIVTFPASMSASVADIVK